MAKKEKTEDEILDAKIKKIVYTVIGGILISCSSMGMNFFGGKVSVDVYNAEKKAQNKRIEQLEKTLTTLPKSVEDLNLTLREVKNNNTKINFKEPEYPGRLCHFQLISSGGLKYSLLSRQILSHE